MPTLESKYDAAPSTTYSGGIAFRGFSVGLEGGTILFLRSRSRHQQHLDCTGRSSIQSTYLLLRCCSRQERPTRESPDGIPRQMAVPDRSIRCRRRARHGVEQPSRRTASIGHARAFFAASRDSDYVFSRLGRMDGFDKRYRCRPKYVSTSRAESGVQGDRIV
jgi:hypothetical protein